MYSLQQQQHLLIYSSRDLQFRAIKDMSMSWNTLSW